MQYIIEGILIGLTLSVLLGPIFIVLIQASIEKGTKAGILAAAGIWISDIIFVVLAVTFINRISSFINTESFSFWLGLIGGAVLIGIGIATVMRKANIEFEKSKMGRSGWFSYLIKGFMVNTVNPFTFFFWLGTIPTLAVNRELNLTEAWLLAGGVLGTIIVTDSLKIFLAKVIREKINERTLTLLNKIAGSALIIFGFVLLLNSVK